jgi:hypothetical protein
MFFPFFLFKKSKKHLTEVYEKTDKKVELMLRSGKRVSSVDWNIVRGIPRGSNPKYQDGSELYKLFITIETKWQKEQEESAYKKREELKNRLILEYGESNAFKILKKELWIGMDMNHIYEVKGKYDYKVENMINKVAQTILYFDKHKNRLGNDAYDFEITLEDGKVVGWKNRANVSTRNL